ncbi:alkene reductase [Paraburkholderia hospita]|uniref:Alkene reductase n=1 Tax=Paraburkholderia hospita TaxID=169430 RepID=A0AAN1JKF2_9BURK|nr:alkene reductase [Paraburkholderia hospita]AUT75636.1 alkene reductase [Paraburkholderia hospita]
MSSHSPLLDGYDLSGLSLPNRVAMAPMTRSRAPLRGRPTEMMAEYYVQRASAGLMVSEATNINAASLAFDLTPGIFTAEQIDGWRHITTQVHAAGGRIFMQLWHSGRVSSFALLGGAAPLSPSGVNDDLEQLQVWAQLQNGQYTKIHATPSRAMSLDEVKLTITDFRQGAVNAIAAGFDGVEVHAANGYLPHQFLSSTTNTRDDRYGGSVANRANFLRDVLAEIGSVVPLNQIGVRISPYANYNNVRDADPDGTYDYVGKMLGEFGVAYVHAADTNGWSGHPDLPRITERLRRVYSGTLMVNGGISVDHAEALIRDGQADLVAFARAYISNPDLVGRIAAHASIAPPKPDGWYGGDTAGYTDYPFDSSAGKNTERGAHLGPAQA